MTQNPEIMEKIGQFNSIKTKLNYKVKTNK